MQTGRSLHLSCRIRRKDGAQRWIQIDGKFEFSADDEPLRLIGVIADITTRKSLEQEADELSERLLTLQEEERQRIARELHDSTAQHLIAVTLNLMSLRSARLSTPDQERLWNDVETSMEEALKELRAFSYLMHPPGLDSNGLHLTLRQYVKGFADRTGLVVKLKLRTSVDNASFRIQRSILRIVQEGLVNVHRHASASRVRVELRCVGKRLHLIIADDGKSIKAPHRNGASDVFTAGVGLQAIKARARQLGGDLKLRTGPHGTTVHAVMPIAEAYGEEAKVLRGSAADPPGLMH
jgi:signal transduction histidine kinase